jgi:hypothetical protein
MKVSDLPDQPLDNGDIRLCRAASMFETVCWTALALAPLLRWANGPAVSDDQFVMQLSIVCLAALGAVGLRVYHWKLERAQRD